MDARITLRRGLLAFALTVPAGAYAQGGKPTPIAPVEVVATRTPEAPHDVPASIEVIPGDQLRARGVASLKDALTLATGISIAPGGDMGPAGIVPEIWGLREFDAFLLVVDGVPWGGAFNPATTTVSLRDVERIEILRGPAPVTFGATSFVGVIHVVHKAAAVDAKYLEAFGGSYGSGGVSLDMPVKTLMPDWKARLSADAEKQGFKDSRTGYQKAHASLRASTGDDARKTWFTVDGTVISQDPASPHPREGAALSTQTPLDANYNPSGAYLDEGRVAIQAGMDRPLGGATWGTTASYTFSSQRILRGFLTNIANTGNNASGFKEEIDINDIYVDSHLIWPQQNGVRFMAGADLLFANADARGATFTYTAPLAATSAPVAALPLNLGLDASNQRLFLGVYANAEWRPDPRLTVSVGGRLNSTSEKVGEDGETANNTRLSGSVGAMYALWESGADHLRAFVSARSTFKPAAFDFGLGDDESAPLKPETSTNYEAGVKYRGLSGRFDAELSYFHLDFENLVTSTVVNNQPSLQNAGKTRFQGYELGLDWKAADDLWVRGTYSAHDAKFVDFVQAFGTTNTQLAGKRFEMSAKELYAVGVTWAPAEGIFASANLNHVGDRYLNKRNTALAPAFSTYDAGVGYRAGRWEVRLDGKNLGDARDAVAESEFGDAQYYRMTAQSIRLAVGMKW